MHYYAAILQIDIVYQQTLLSGIEHNYWQLAQMQ